MDLVNAVPALHSPFAFYPVPSSPLAYAPSPSRPPSGRNPRAARRWEDLISGELVIVGQAVDDTHASLFVKPSTSRSCPTPEAATMLQRVLSGCPQKVVAMDRGVAASTASLQITRALEIIGVRSTIRRSPFGLVVLAICHAGGAAHSPPGYHERFTSNLGELELRMRRPEAALRSVLTPAEFAVLQKVLEGDAQQAVGQARGRSARTVANQLQSISFKLGVCGRFQYLKLALEMTATPADAQGR